MDKTLARIVEYTEAFTTAEMDNPNVKEAAMGRLFDTMAVSLVGSGAEPAQIGARLAKAYENDNGASIWGYGIKTAPDVAAQVNTMSVRTYDYNDGGLSHPSDMTPGVLAAAELAHASGIETLTAITLAYEILWGLGFGIGVKQGAAGFDQGLFQGVAVALAAGKLWGFNTDQLANAASLGVSSNLPMRVSRATGTLSMMKGCSTSFNVRAGVWSAMLAREGFTAAPDPFQGKGGLAEILRADVTPYLPVSQAKPPAPTRAIEMTTVKVLPAENNVQGLLALVPRIRAFASVDDMESIDVQIPVELVDHISDEAKFDPKTRETADHSLPYMMSVMMVDGKLTLDSYTPERIADPALRPLMRKFHVTGNQAYSDARNAPVQSEGVAAPRPASIRIRTRDGREFAEEVFSQKGDTANPLTRDDFNFKFDTICGQMPTLSAEQRERIRDAWWHVDTSSDIGAAIRTLVGYRSL